MQPDKDSATAPPIEVLAANGVQLLSTLGGRANKHWIVKTQHQQLVLRRWSDQPPGSIEYERKLVTRLDAMGWPVAPLEEPIEFDGHLWSLCRLLQGYPPDPDGELRKRGQLLAKFHADTAQITDLVQRPNWRRCEDVLADETLDKTLSANEATLPEEVKIVRWHLNRARLRAENLHLESWASIPIHGDFTTWNLLFQGDRLTGILDFELAHDDHRVGDFVLSWRGKYDEVIHAYHEVSPLQPEEWAAIVPIWWAQLVDDACRNMRQGIHDDGWTIRKLLTRSALMGPDAEELP